MRIRKFVVSTGIVLAAAAFGAPAVAGAVSDSGETAGPPASAESALQRDSNGDVVVRVPAAPHDSVGDREGTGDREMTGDREVIGDRDAAVSALQRDSNGDVVVTVGPAPADHPANR